MFDYFYHEILRKTVISFGTLFNNIIIKKIADDGSTNSIIKVPLAYGPTQKFLARLEQSPNLNKPIQITLPRMSFEFVGLTYDPARKLTTTQTFLTKSIEDDTEIKKAYMPVPYNMQFELSIMTKINDDMLQIVEQILPYFQPSYTLTVNLVESIGENRDIPITLDSIDMQDDYEGDFNTRRALIYTLKFTAKTYLFGPISSGNKDIIKKVAVSYISGDSKSIGRDLTYKVTPLATKNYTNNIVTVLDIDTDSISEFISVNDPGNIPINSYITIDDETLLVLSKEENIIKVQRGSYDTKPSDHVYGTEIKLITPQDNELIPFGDDFGFSGLFE